VSRGIVVQEQDPFGEFPAAFFLQTILQLHQHRVDRLALWKIINEEDAVLIPKIEARNFSAEFYTRKVWGGVSRFAATPLIVAFSPGHGDITRFRPWSPIVTRIHLDRAE